MLDNDEMNNLIESVQQQGIMTPLIVRPLEGTTDEYEIISGHRRFRAAQKAGLTEVPAFIRPVSRDEAAIMLVDSNLHREHLLPSEKAFAYKLKYDALKRSPGRKENGDQVGHQTKSIDRLAADSPDSRNQIQRYIRLTNLIPDILKLVDEGRIALTPAVELSYLNSHEQEVLNEIMSCDELTPSLSQAQRLRKLSEDYTLTDSGISQIMSEIKGNQKEYLKIEAAPLRRYFPPGTTAKQMQTTMLRAMEFYRQHTQNRADNPKEREER